MNFVVFDTETISINKPFCYDIGYVIANERGEMLKKVNYLVAEIWNNAPLFETAYYAEKRPKYEELLKEKTIKKNRFEKIIEYMQNDFDGYEIQYALAYNSKFDEKVFNFNCEWFHCINPFDNITIKDIRGYAHNFICKGDYISFCEKNNLFTEAGNYSTTAEAVYRYIMNDTDFIEAHTALNDAEIELAILMYCLDYNINCTLDSEYPTKISIPRKVEKELHITTPEHTDYYFKYNSIKISKDKTEITLK